MTEANGNGNHIPRRQIGRFSDAEWERIRAAVEAARAAKAALEAKPKREYPLAFGYRRCSHEDSKKSQLGLEAQQQIVEAYFGVLQAKDPALQNAGSCRIAATLTCSVCPRGMMRNVGTGG